MMTSGAIEANGAEPIYPFGDRVLYYRPKALFVHCSSGDCNYDMPLANLMSPIITADAWARGQIIKKVDVK